ncbi:MAG: hypothetical protein R3F34_08115 [Planctomycetota bacterium]
MTESKSYVRARQARRRSAASGASPEDSSSGVLARLGSHPFAVGVAWALAAVLLAVAFAFTFALLLDEPFLVQLAAAVPTLTLVTKFLGGVVLCVHAAFDFIAWSRSGEGRDDRRLVLPCMTAAIGVPLLTGASSAAIGFGAVAAVVLWRSPRIGDAAENGATSDAVGDDAPTEERERGDEVLE